MPDELPGELPGELMEELDYTIDEHGLLVFTASYLARRGTCCGNGCRNCPYRGKPHLEQQTCGDNDDLT